MESTKKYLAAGLTVVALSVVTACGGGGDGSASSSAAPQQGSQGPVASFKALDSAARHWDANSKDAAGQATAFYMEAFDDGTFLGYYLDSSNTSAAYGGVVGGAGTLVTGASSQFWQTSRAVDYSFASPVASAIELDTALQVGVADNGLANFVGSYASAAGRHDFAMSTSALDTATAVKVEQLAGAYRGLVFDRNSTAADPAQGLVIASDGGVRGQYGKCTFLGKLEPVANRAVARTALDFVGTCDALKTARAMAVQFNARGGFVLVAAADDGAGAFMALYDPVQ